jgi:hypothetical protein
MLSVKSDALRRHAELGIEGALGALVGHEFDPAHQPETARLTHERVLAQSV